MPHDLPSRRPEPPTGAIPWNILPQGSYPHPYQSGPRVQRFPFSATTVADLPLSSDTLFFIAQGSGLSGALNINDDGQHGSDIVKVDIRMYYTHSYLAESAQAWREEPSAGQNGIKIQAPLHCAFSENMFFDVKVHLPPGSPLDRQQISRFETDLPQFAHFIGNLADSIHFDILSLRSVNGLITSQSLLTMTALLSTTNAAIDGRFTCTNSLNLKTTNGIINADVSLLNDGDGASAVDMETSNGRINSSISLVSTAQNGSGGAYKVSAKSSNGAVSIAFPQAPLNSTQQIDAQTSNGALSVQAHDTFEGEFRLQTSNGFPSLQRDAARMQDPAGLSRGRCVTYTAGRGAIAGSASWGNPEPDRVYGGGARLKTSNGSVTLVL